MHANNGVILRALRPTKRTFACAATTSTTFRPTARNFRGFPTAVVLNHLAEKAAAAVALHRMSVHRLLPTERTAQNRRFGGTPTMRDITPFLLADIGEGITECELVQWFIKPGDKVLEFDKICEVQSDKASVEITSRFAGEIKKLHYKVGEMAKVGHPLVDLETAGGTGGRASAPTVVSPLPKPLDAKAVTAIAAEPTGDGDVEETLATPAVRRIARENGVDLKQVKGSGKGGRIMKEDVLIFSKAGSATASLAHATAIRDTLPASAAWPVTAPTKQPLTTHQIAMFKQMTKSLAIPHFGYSDEFELDELTKLRNSLNARLHADSGATMLARYPQLSKTRKISYLPFFIKSLSLSLNSFPLLNAQLVIENPQDPGSAHLVFRPSHNVGVAMDTPRGLLVPNIKDVQRKSVLEVADELARLQEAVGRGVLQPADLSGGTVSLSNIGTVGGTNLNPVVVTTELCIVALGRMRRLPRFETVALEGGGSEERVVAKQIVNVSWSADHRVVDGATIARFNELWRLYVEDPSLMLCELR